LIRYRLRPLLFIACWLPVLLVFACASSDPDPDFEADADHDADIHRPEPEPIVCDPSYNDSLDRGDLAADLAGLEGYAGYSSSDVDFIFDDMSRPDGRFMLSVHAIEWCRPGIQKSDFRLTCLILPADLETLPLTMHFSETFISGKNSCKVNFTDSRAVYSKSPDGGMTFKTFEVDTGVSGTFEASLTESTDPDHTLTFSNGAFEAIPED